MTRLSPVTPGELLREGFLLAKPGHMLAALKGCRKVIYGDELPTILWRASFGLATFDDLSNTNILYRFTSTIDSQLALSRNGRL